MSVLSVLPGLITRIEKIEICEDDGDQIYKSKKIYYSDLFIE